MKVVIETHGSNSDHDQEKLESFLENAMENGIVVNGTVAETSTQVNQLWVLVLHCFFNLNDFPKKNRIKSVNFIKSK